MNKKRALFIYRVNRAEESNTGVVKKLIGQIDGLETQNYKADFIIHDDNGIFHNNKLIYPSKGGSNNIRFKWNFYNYISGINLNGFDLYFVRYGLTTMSFLKWLQQIRSNNPQAKIIIDMPTFPYKREWKGLYGQIVLSIDKVLSLKLKNYVDIILHSGNEKEIFGIPVIPFSNGIQLESVAKRVPKKHKGIHLLAVGKWQFWHGLDRVIAGLKNYIREGNDDVKLTIVGDGPIIGELKKMCTDFALGDLVTFSGVCVGKKLDDLFNDADIGIGTLGLHRKNVSVDSSLKHREYMARGLPFIIGAKDSDIKNLPQFVIKIPGDNSEVDFKKLFKHFERFDYVKAIHVMRDYANQHLSWRSKMKNLILQIEQRN